MKPGFYGKMGLDVLSGGYAVTQNAITYWSLYGERYDLPANSVTDGASSRTLFGHINLLPTNAQNSAPAWMHDHHYRTGRRWNNGISSAITRLQADKLFREGLIMTNVSGYTALKAYIGVRIFGWNTWNNYRKHKV